MTGATVYMKKHKHQVPSDYSQMTYFVVTRTLLLWVMLSLNLGCTIFGSVTQKQLLGTNTTTISLYVSIIFLECPKIIFFLFGKSNLPIGVSF